MLVAWVMTAALLDVCHEAEDKFPLETGGVLLGRWDTPHQLTVTHAIGPGARARHEASLFEPDYDHHEQEISRIYNESKGATTYLGDWHTHPDGSPRLSRKDRHLIAQMAEHKESRLAQPLMAVLGGHPEWTLLIWVYRPRSITRFRRGAVVTACDVRRL